MNTSITVSVFDFFFCENHIYFEIQRWFQRGKLFFNVLINYISEVIKYLYFFNPNSRLIDYIVILIDQHKRIFFSQVSLY